MLLNPADLTVEPIERAETIPSTWYTSEEIFALELESIFRHSWQFLGSVSRLPEIGSHILAEIGKESIIVVRGKDNVIRAFYNVCRHRGGPLAMVDGCASMLQCKYHGWTYTLDGMLRGVPDFDRVDLFDKKDYGLIPIHVREWEGLIFGCLDEPSVPFEVVMEGVAERIQNTDLLNLQFHSRVVYTVRSNWKAYVDNYLEEYHVPIVHSKGLFKIYDFNRYITETRDWYSFQHSPLSEDEAFYSGFLRPGKKREAIYYHVYPNFMMNILPGRLQTNLVLPVSPNECRVVFEYYYEDISSEEMLPRIAEDIRFSDEVQAEDIEICEYVQRGLSSSAYDRGRFSVKREKALYHFQCLLKREFAKTQD